MFCVVSTVDWCSATSICDGIISTAVYTEALKLVAVFGGMRGHDLTTWRHYPAGDIIQLARPCLGHHLGMSTPPKCPPKILFLSSSKSLKLPKITQNTKNGQTNLNGKKIPTKKWMKNLQNKNKSGLKHQNWPKNVKKKVKHTKITKISKNSSSVSGHQCYMRGSHGLSARRVRRTKSIGPKGLQLDF